MMTSSPKELRAVLEATEAWLPWPLAYTFDGTTCGEYLVDVLQMHSATYVGASPDAIRYTSKTHFKKALESAGFRTPNWELRPTQFGAFPFYLKGGHSVESSAVRLVNSAAARDRAIDEINCLDVGTTFAEQPISGREVTAALVRGPQETHVALLGMEPIGRPYIDEYAKHHNEAIAFTPVSGESAAAIRAATNDMACALGITGYCRIDAIVTAESREPYFFDINLLPGLNADPKEYSYFPMAFQVQAGLDFDTTIEMILRAALASPGHLCDANETLVHDPIPDWELSSHGRGTMTRAAV